MTTVSGICLIAALAVAAANLYAVGASRKRIEAISKPAVMVFLIAGAVTLQPHSDAQRWLFVLGLALGLVGDLLLLPQVDCLVAAIVVFGAGHVAYIAGFRLIGFNPLWAAAGLLLVLVAVAALVPPMLRQLRRSGRSRLLGPVFAYVVVISAFMVSAAGTGRPVAAIGALLFYASDGLLGWYRFVGPLRWGRPVNIVLYQLGQALLVLSLAA